jgi:hypothetical protein
MRNFILLVTTAASLAACGGAGPETVGSIAAGPVSGVSTDPHSFVKPTQVKTYDAVGSTQHYEYQTRSDGNGQGGQLYAGDANAVRDSGISVTYNPRDAIFDIAINRPKANVNTSTRFQDPAHRTDFGGNSEPQVGVPPIDPGKQIQYLQAGSASGNIIAPEGNGRYVQGNAGFTSAIHTFFYQKPGTTTQYVTYGGYVDNRISTEQVTENVTDANGQPVNGPDGQPLTRKYLVNKYALDRAVFAWGERTDNGAVPRSGTASYRGDMLATMVYNDQLDVDASTPTYFQWITGSNTTSVDFGALTVKTTMTGTVNAPALDANTSGQYSVPGGSTFTATGAGSIDLVGTGGFVGSFSEAKITPPTGAIDPVTIAGSSFDGAFFGPKAQEVGGGFRIVGGTPDQRVDIHGVFTGKQ